MIIKIAFTILVTGFSMATANAARLTFSKAHQLLCREAVAQYPERFGRVATCLQETQVEEYGNDLTLEFDTCPDSDELVRIYLNTKSLEITSASEGYDCE